MKRIAALVLIATLAGACSANDTHPAAQPANESGGAERGEAATASRTGEASESAGAEAGATEDLEALGDVQVDRNLLSVEITIPPDFVDGADIATIREQARDQGIRDVTLNDDGSVTYRMSRSQHRRLMTDIRAEISESLDDLSEDFPSIQQVRHNRDFTQVTLTVDRAAWEGGFDGFATLAIAMGAGLYHIFDGTDPDDVRINIDIIDADSGDTFNTIVLPDDWDD